MHRMGAMTGEKVKTMRAASPLRVAKLRRRERRGVGRRKKRRKWGRV